jgi:phosphoglycolate phosphatase
LQYDGVIFDLDGTLVDTLEDIADAMNRVLASERAPVHSYDAYRHLIGWGLRNLVAESLPADKRDPATISRCYDAMVADYGQHCLDKTRPYGGISELLDALRAEGVRMAVFSNKADELTRRIAEALLDVKAFAVIVGARPGVPLKPDPAVALEIAAGFALAAERIVYLGDSLVDMKTATVAGMIAVGASWGFRTRDELVESGARVVLDHPLELLELRR